MSIVEHIDKERAKQARRTIIKELRRLDKSLERPENYVMFRAGMVLMAVYMFGAAVDIVSHITAQPEKFVKQVLARCRKRGILRGEVLRLDWDGESARFAALLDVMVAGGELTRGGDPKKPKPKRPAQPRRTTEAPRRKRAAVGVYTPKVRKVRGGSFYGLTEWERDRAKKVG